MIKEADMGEMIGVAMTEAVGVTIVVLATIAEDGIINEVAGNRTLFRKGKPADKVH